MMSCSIGLSRNIEYSIVEMMTIFLEDWDHQRKRICQSTPSSHLSGMEREKNENFLG